VTLPSGQTLNARPWDHEPTPLQKALVRAHRWLAMLESGEYRSVKELAAKEGVDNSYISRMMNLTTLAPDIVTAILDERVPQDLLLLDMAISPPMLWDDQRAAFGLGKS
jgi:hypothetical protein